MPSFDILGERLDNQRLVGLPHDGPANVVRAMGAVQAQDYRGSLWGIGMRTKGALEADVERAIADREIVRTWPMRGTLHFVAPEDIRWMLCLLAPRVVTRAAGRYRQLELDEATFTKSRARLEKVLTGGMALTRYEAYAEFERARVSPAGQRGIHILGVLAMRGVICFGSRRDRQPTFVLLDEWIPASRDLDRDEALGELARRYFVSHGPASERDFAWWSGLTLGETRRALDIAGNALTKHVTCDQTYWSGPAAAPRRRATIAHLLPAYDEFTVAYRDRSAFLDEAYAERTRNGIFSQVVTIDGRIAGLWRARRSGQSPVAVDLFERSTAAARRAVDQAIERYARFAGTAVGRGRARR